MPRHTFTARYAMLTWSPEEDVEQYQFEPTSTSTTTTSALRVSAVSAAICEWVSKWAEQVHAVRQRHPGGKWHWHVFFRMKREYSSTYFYDKKTATSWWKRDMGEELGKENITVTPKEDARALGYMFDDEVVILHSDFDEAFHETAKQWYLAQTRRAARRSYLSQIYTLPKAKIHDAVVTAMVDYNLSDEHEAEARLVDEGWTWEGNAAHAGMKRKRYLDTRAAQ